MQRIWAVVVLVGLGLASITTLTAVHADSVAVMGYISATVVPTVAVLLGWQQLGTQLGQVHEKVNGHLAQLTSAKTIVDPAAVLPPPLADAVPTMPAESGPDPGGTGVS